MDYQLPITVRELRRQLKPISATVRIEGVLSVKSRSHEVGFTVPVSEHLQIIAPDTRYITANMRVVDYDEERGYMVEVEYYRPDLVTVNDVIFRLSEILHDDLVDIDKYIDLIMNDPLNPFK